jgi:hypothetical protein
MRDEYSKEMNNVVAMLRIMVPGENNIRTGRLSGQDEVFDRIEARLAERRKPFAIHYEGEKTCPVNVSEKAKANPNGAKP